MRRWLLLFPAVFALIIPQETFAAMSFDDCVAINRGQPINYVQTWQALGEKIFKSAVERTEKGTIDILQTANEKMTNEVPFGFYASGSGMTTTEKATGEKKVVGMRKDYGVDIPAMVKTLGQTVYSVNVSVLDKNTWKPAALRNVQVTVREHEAIVVEGCAISVVLVTLITPDGSGKFDNDGRQEVLYSPAAMLTLKTSDIFEERPPIVYREVKGIEVVH
jgi:hypothetical protein